MNFLKLKFLMTWQEKKILISFFIFHTLIAILNIIRFNQITFSYGLDGDLISFLLFSIGGRQYPFIIWSVAQYYFIIFSVLISIQLLDSKIEDMESLLKSRVSSYKSWWIYSCVESFFLSIAFVSIILICYFLVGFIALGNNFELYSQYSKEFHRSIIEYSFLEWIMILIFNKLIGLTIIINILRLIQMITKDKSSTYLLYITFLSITGFIAIVAGNITDHLQILLYPSIFSIVKDGELITNIIIRIIILVSSVLTGWWLSGVYGYTTDW